MMNRGPQPLFSPQRSRLPQSQHPLFLAQDSSMKDSSKAGRYDCQFFWADARQSLSTTPRGFSTTNFWQPSMPRYFAMANGSSASAVDGPTIKVVKTSWHGAGSRTTIDVSLQST